MDILRLLNIIISTLSLPPSLYLLAKVVRQEHNGTNTGLRVLFGGLSLVAIANATISILSVAGYGSVAHTVSLVSRVFASSVILIVVWLWYFISREK